MEPKYLSDRDWGLFFKDNILNFYLSIKQTKVYILKEPCWLG